MLRRDSGLWLVLVSGSCTQHDSGSQMLSPDSGMRFVLEAGQAATYNGTKGLGFRDLGPRA